MGLEVLVVGNGDYVHKLKEAFSKRGDYIHIVNYEYNCENDSEYAKNIDVVICDLDADKYTGPHLYRSLMKKRFKGKFIMYFPFEEYPNHWELYNKLGMKNGNLEFINSSTELPSKLVKRIDGICIDKLNGFNKEIRGDIFSIEVYGLSSLALTAASLLSSYSLFSAESYSAVSIPIILAFFANTFLFQKIQHHKENVDRLRKIASKLKR